MERSEKFEKSSSIGESTIVATPSSRSHGLLTTPIMTTPTVNKSNSPVIIPNPDVAGPCKYTALKIENMLLQFG